jgi:hypothetical protein
LNDLAILLGVTLAGADVREAQSPEQLADAALVIGDAEPLFDDPLEVDAPPAHRAVDRRVRAGSHYPGKLRLLRRRQPPRISPAAVILQSGGTKRVEAMGPVAQRLPVHAADLRRLCAAHPVQNRRNRQQPPALARVLRRYRQTAQFRRRMARSDLNDSRLQTSYDLATEETVKKDEIAAINDYLPLAQ